MHYDRSDYPILDAMDLQALPGAWEFSQGAPIVCDEDIARRNWALGGPVILRAFHGTTHLFEEFDARRARHDNFLGQAIYFTSSHYDCVTNYATSNGPDLIQHVEEEAARLEDLIAEDPEAYWCCDDSPEGIENRARHLAEAKLIGDTERVIEVLIRIEKPFIISPEPGGRGTPVFPELDDAREEARRDVCQDHDIDPDDFEAQEEIEEEIHEAMDRVTEQAQDDLQMAFLKAVSELAEPGLSCPAELNLDEPIYDLTTHQLWELIRSNDRLLDLCDEEGRTVRDSLVPRIAHHLGFDSILLLNADRQFRMNMDTETSHIHLTGHRPDQILVIDRDLRKIDYLNAA